MNRTDTVINMMLRISAVSLLRPRAYITVISNHTFHLNHSTDRLFSVFQMPNRISLVIPVPASALITVNLV